MVGQDSAAATATSLVAGIARDAAPIAIATVKTLFRWLSIRYLLVEKL